MITAFHYITLQYTYRNIYALTYIMENKLNAYMIDYSTFGLIGTSDILDNYEYSFRKGADNTDGNLIK